MMIFVFNRLAMFRFKSSSICIVNYGREIQPIEDDRGRGNGRGKSSP
jgi:hypothetical protein